MQQKTPFSDFTTWSNPRNCGGHGSQIRQSNLSRMKNLVAMPVFSRVKHS